MCFIRCKKLMQQRKIRKVSCYLCLDYDLLGFDAVYFDVFELTCQRNLLIPYSVYRTET